MGATEYVPNGPERLITTPAQRPEAPRSEDEERSRSRQSDRRSFSEGPGARNRRENPRRYTGRYTGHEVQMLNPVGPMWGADGDIYFSDAELRYWAIANTHPT